MKHIATFFILILLSFQLIAQDYAPLVEGRSYLFASNKTNQSQVGTLGFRVDISAVNGGNTYFKPVRVPYYCQDQWQPLPRLLWPGRDGRAYPWLQQSYYVDSSGVYFFQNQFQEKISLHTKSQIGQYWSFFSYPNAESIIATHDSTVYQPVFAGWDSVKYFHLQLLDSLGDTLQSSLNGTELQLAKENGIIQTIRFECFPRGIVDTLFQGDKSMVLFQIGATNPDVGKYPLAERHIFDYEVGDMIQETLSFVSARFDHGTSYYENIILAKTQENNKITYRISHREWNQRYDRENDIETVDCKKYQYNLAVDLTKAAYLPLIPEDKYSGLIYDYSGNKKTGTRRHLPPSTYVSFADSCFYEPPDAIGYYQIAGLGAGYHNYGGSFSRSSTYSPTYYKKGNETWGTYINFDSLSCTVGLESELLQNTHITFQNNLLTIRQDNPQPLTFQLFSMDEKLITQLKLAPEAVLHIPLPFLPEGIYAYHLIGKNGRRVVGKFLIK